jgi:UDP-2,3-diacylglucosamine hydrolase
MSILFVSDVHVGAQTARATQAFLEFVRGPAHDAQAVYLLGDVFDAWLGDDDLRPPHPHVAHALAALVQGGTQVNAVHGNHDFLLGSAFMEATGANLLPEVSTLMLGEHYTVLCHGDELCTDDLKYQRYRQYTRDGANQQQFLALSLAERGQEAMRLRQASAQATAEKAENIMDVNAEAVAALLRQHGGSWLIHGHTHRPADHALTVDGRECARFVLGNWHEHESILEWNGQALVRTTVDALKGR